MNFQERFYEVLSISNALIWDYLLSMVKKIISKKDSYILYFILVNERHNVKRQIITNWNIILFLLLVGDLRQIIPIKSLYQ